ncbi:MAG: TRAP transporter small permease [Albidovulum sp.]|nr:TRAP transporter small permease [Albidovulum sp.]
MSRAGKREAGKETGNLSRGRALHSPGGRVGAILENLAGAVAMAGGILLTAVMGMTVVSVFGRYVLDAPIPGDYELTELACGVAVFAFFPYCHAKNGNIVVGFVTGRMHPRYKAALDALHNIVFAIVACLITWRLFVGAVQKLADGETTMFLGAPLYLAYFPALAGAGLLVAVCVLKACCHLQALRQ